MSGFFKNLYPLYPCPATPAHPPSGFATRQVLSAVISRFEIAPDTQTVK
jgi:hypothetical protein